MKRAQLNFKNRGFFTVEAMLSASVFALFVLIFSGIYIYGQEATVLSGNRSRAIYLAEEGVEVARNLRDENFTNLIDGTHGLLVSGGVWSLSGSQDTEGIFTRSLSIASIDSNRKEVTSTVTWEQNPQRTGSVSLVTRFTNWLRAGATGAWPNVAQAFSYDITGTADGIKVQTQGDYAYLITNAGNPDFFIFNISSPASATLSSSLNPIDTLTNIFVSGNYAYVTSQSNTSELQIIDISNPSSPAIVSFVNLAGNSNASGVYVSGNYAYVVKVSSGGDEFFVVDVTNPLAPSVVGSLNLGATGYEVVVSGNYAYVSSGSNSQEVQVINITNPATPSLAGSLNLSGNSDALTISISGSVLYVGQGSTFYTVDISTPGTPTLLGNTNLNGGTAYDISLGVADSTYVFVGTSQNANEFQIIDISTASSPSVANTYNISGNQIIYGVAYNADLDLVVGASGSDTEEFIIFIPN